MVARLDGSIAAPRAGGANQTYVYHGTPYTEAIAPYVVGGHVDGTLGVCWHGALEVMEAYDAAWLAEQRANHPKGFEILAGLRDQD